MSKTLIDPKLEINFEVDINGEVEPKLLMGIKPNAEMIEEMAQMSNPHYVIVVSYERETNYGDGTDYTRQVQTSVDITKATAPFRYVQFAKPGRNRVFVDVVDIVTTENRRDANMLTSRNSDIISGYFTSNGRIGQQLDRTHMSLRLLGAVTFHDVDIDPDLFAPPPSGWRKAVVEHFFVLSGLADQCKYRKLWIPFSILEFFVQAIGLIVRPVCVLLVLLFGCRDIRWKSLGSLRITGFWTDSGSSRWFTDSNERSRTDWVRYINPVTVIGAIAVLFIIPFVAFLIFNIQAHRGLSEEKYSIVDWGWWQTVFIVDGGIAAVVVTVLAVIQLRSKLEEYKIRRRQRQNSMPEISLSEEERRARRELLIAASGQSSTLDWDLIPASSKTVYLRFNRIKTKVCKPFAHS